MGTRGCRQPVRRSNDRQADSRKIEEWRNGPHRDGCGNRGGVAALFLGGYSFNAPPLSGDISRQQRSYAGRARDGIHDFSEWRLATEHAAYSGADRGKRRNTGVEWEAAKHPEDRDQTRNRVRSAFVPRRCASIGNRKSRLHTVWAKEIPGRRKNRDCVRFYGRALCWIRFQFHLRRVGWLR